jgi:hypothetical protein
MQIGDVNVTFESTYNYGTYDSAGFTTLGTDGIVKVRYVAISDEMFCECALPQLTRIFVFQLFDDRDYMYIGWVLFGVLISHRLTVISSRGRD